MITNQRLKHAAIVGAGLAGRLLAMRLLESGWRVSLFDKDDPSGQQSCGLIAAGMLSPCAEIETADSRIFHLGLESIKLWPGIIAKLKRDTGKDIFWQHRGSLTIAHGQDQEELEHFIAGLRCKLKTIDNIDNYVQALEKSQIPEFEPALQHLTSGYFFPQEAHLSSSDVFTALRDFITKHKQAAWYSSSPIDHVDGRTLIHQGQPRYFDMVFDCRGLGARHQLKDLRAVRGELIWLQSTEVRITRPVRLMHPRYRLYLVPRPDHMYILGASEIEAEDYSPLSVRTGLELLSAAYSINPAFAEARIIDTKVNCRPAFSDNQPKIELKPERGYCSINGLYRHGYLLAPALIEQLIREL